MKRWGDEKEEKSQAVFEENEKGEKEEDEEVKE